MQAMILAAGFGTRLRPYTLCKPKPLFPILNVPLLHILLDKLVRAGCNRIVVNGHHLADQIRDSLAEREEVIFQYEPEILGTGGSLRKALPLFADEPVLVMNGDIYHEIDLSRLLACHADTDCLVSMAMHDYARFNSVVVRDDRVSGFVPEKRVATEKLLAFTGIHVLERAVMEQIPAKGFFHIIDLYKQLARAGQVASVRVDNSFWRDIGTEADYLGLHRQLLVDLQWGAAKPTKSWSIAEGAVVGENVQLNEWGSIGSGAVIGDICRLTRCVVWENVRIAPGQQLADTVVCEDVFA
jgi:mannose-1-phosphate guanylyltransferase